MCGGSKLCGSPYLPSTRSILLDLPVWLRRTSGPKQARPKPMRTLRGYLPVNQVTLQDDLFEVLVAGRLPQSYNPMCALCIRLHRTSMEVHCLIGPYFQSHRERYLSTIKLHSAIVYKRNKQCSIVIRLHGTLVNFPGGIFLDAMYYSENSYQYRLSCNGGVHMSAPGVERFRIVCQTTLGTLCLRTGRTRLQSRLSDYRMSRKLLNLPVKMEHRMPGPRML